MIIKNKQDLLIASLEKYTQIIGSYQYFGQQLINVVILAEVRKGLKNRKFGFPVSLRINATWDLIPPEARFLCKPEWLRCGADWHVYSNRSICYEYDRHWADHFAQLKIGTQDKADCAAQWIVNGISNVIRGQVDSYRLGVNVWTEMPETAWPHGDVLAKEMYFKENPNRRGVVVKHSQN